MIRTSGLLYTCAALALLASPATGAEEEKAVSKTPDAIATIDAFIEARSIDRSDPDWKSSLPKPPQVEFDEKKKYYWNLDTSVGSMKIKLRPDVAPMHVSSTIYLTRLGFYDGVGFHRVIKGFMAQGGDPEGTGAGGPGYVYDGEFSMKLRHDRAGRLSMANRGAGTDGSQFFLTFTKTPHLDGKHTVFGQVVEGKTTLKALERRGSRRGQPTEALLIQSATVSVE